MLRRQFLKSSAALGAGLAAGDLVSNVAQAQRAGVERIILGGYAPAESSFGQGLDLIGERLEARFGNAVEVRYVYNVIDIGYEAGNSLLWLVDSGLITLGYLSIADQVDALNVAALPFLFPDEASARAVMDGPLGAAAAAQMESQTNYRVLGFFENGLRHISNSVRPVRTPADVRGLRIRPHRSQLRLFELLGAAGPVIELPATIPLMADGTVHGQENPFENIVSYGIHDVQRYYTTTAHSYLSRPIFVNRERFDAWPAQLQQEMRAAVAEAVRLQRELHDREELAAREIIEAAGGEIVDLTPAQRAEFVAVAEPIYAEARETYSADLLALVGL
jgi:TRAP-type C4-dicarboxylate transport system substrate-binding protein